MADDNALYPSEQLGTEPSGEHVRPTREHMVSRTRPAPQSGIDRAMAKLADREPRVERPRAPRK
jgi:hypothetical protein